MPTLRIIDVLSGMEAQALRASAECWGYDVAVTWVGNSRQIVDVFQHSLPIDVLIIAGHGDEDGLVLPELDESVAGGFPYLDRISAAQLAEFARPVASVIIATACTFGLPQYAEVFRNAGTRYYVGPTDYANAGAAMMYSLGFLYAFQCNGLHAALAHEAAFSQSDDRRMFKLHRA
jgi:hypothetical protein